MKKNNTIFAACLLSGSILLQACDIKIDIEKKPIELPTTYVYAETPVNGVDINIADCKNGHHIICELEGDIYSKDYSYDHTGQAYPIYFLLKDESTCFSNTYLSLHISIECTRQDSEYVYGLIKCYDETDGGIELANSQTGEVWFNCY